MRGEAPGLRTLAAWGLAIGLALLDPPHGTRRAVDTAGWLGSLRDGIARREYAAGRDALGLQAPNRAHGLRTYFTPEGIRVHDRVHDRTAPGSPALLALSATGLGRGEPLAAVPPGEVASEGNRVEIRRGALVEWYLNSSHGLEQGFDVAEAPAGAGPLVVEIAVGRARARLRDGELLLASGHRTLRYGKLAAADARGRALPAHRELRTSGSFRLVVDDSGAAFLFLGGPSGIPDGTPASAAARLEADQTNAALGWSVAGAGDVNGDGYDDVIAGAYLYDAGQDHEGAAFVFLGGAGGISDASPATAAAQLESDQERADLGVSVAGAGDVNDDGYDDVVVGAYLYSEPGETSEGLALVFLGGAAECGNGLDDDGDALVDFPADPGCTHAADWERSPALPCDDGDDDDGDGFAGYPEDPGCRDPLSSKEDPACQDGLNNDGQFGTDFDGGVSAGAFPDPNGADPQCTVPWKNKEKNPGCGIGFELVLALAALRALGVRAPAVGARTLANGGREEPLRS